MKRILILLLILAGGFSSIALAKATNVCDANESRSLKNKEFRIDRQILNFNYKNSSFNYKKIGGSIALIVPLFDIGIGHREKYDGFAIDTSLDLSTLVVVNSLDGNLKFLKYLDKFYAGAGLSAGVSFLMILPVALQAKPFITFGKENKNNFHEINFSVIESSTLGIIFIPTVQYSYGFKF